MSWQAHTFTVLNFIHVMGKETTSAQMNVAQLVAHYADRSGRNIRPSVETIAGLIGRDVRTVQRTLRELEQGWLRCVHRSTGSRASEYEITPMVDGLNPGTDAGVKLSVDPGTHAGETRMTTPAPASMHPGVDATVTPAPASQNPGTGATQSVDTSEENQEISQSAHARETGAAAPLPVVDDDMVRRLFEIWRDTHEQPHAVLTDDRRKLIRKQLRTYGFNQLYRAVHGYTQSAFHHGVNDQGQRYVQIETLLRDAKSIETGINLWHSPPASPPLSARKP